MKVISEFFALTYSIRVTEGTIDKISKNPSKKDRFTIISFYQVLTSKGMTTFPWKDKWKKKAPPKASFIVWTTYLKKDSFYRKS